MNNLSHSKYLKGKVKNLDNTTFSMKAKDWLILIGFGVAGATALYFLSLKKPTVPPTIAAAPPVALPEKRIEAPKEFFEHYEPTPTPTPAGVVPEEWTEGESLDIARAYGQAHIEPGFETEAEYTCQLIHTGTTILRTPYGWAFNFSYICYFEAGGTATSYYTINVIQGVPSMG